MKITSLLTLMICLHFSLTATSVQASTTAARSLSVAAQPSKKTSNKLKVSSREQALQLVKRQYKGKVLKAQSARVNGRPGYKVKMLSKKGLVFYISVDAQTGSVRRN